MSVLSTESASSFKSIRRRHLLAPTIVTCIVFPLAAFHSEKSELAIRQRRRKVEDQSSEKTYSSNRGKVSSEFISVSGDQVGVLCDGADDFISLFHWNHLGGRSPRKCRGSDCRESKQNRKSNISKSVPETYGGDMVPDTSTILTKIHF